jgi:hypothetical protein
MGWNPTRGMDVCVRLFSLCVVLCVESGLAMGTDHTENIASIVKEACLLVRYLALDVLLFHAYAPQECVYRVAA